MDAVMDSGAETVRGKDRYRVDYRQRIRLQASEGVASGGYASSGRLRENIRRAADRHRPRARAARQICLDKGWAVRLEYTDDPHPRNTYREMWGHSMFDIRDAKAITCELVQRRRMHGDLYIRINAFDSSPGWESLRLSFIVNRPAEEPGFVLSRQEGAGRSQHYTKRAHSADKPSGQRCGQG